MESLLSLLVGMFGSVNIAATALVALFVAPSIAITVLASVWRQSYLASHQHSLLNNKRLSKSLLKEAHVVANNTDYNFDDLSHYFIDPQGYNIDMSISRDVIKTLNDNNMLTGNDSSHSSYALKCKEEALRIADRLVAEQAKDKRLQLAREYVNTNQFSRGLALLEEVTCHYKSLNRDEAVSKDLTVQQKRAYELQDKQFSLTFLYLAALEWIQNNNEIAINLYKQATMLDQQCLEAWNRLGQIYDFLGRYDRAISCYQCADEIGEKRRASKLENVIHHNLEFLYEKKLDPKRKYH